MTPLMDMWEEHDYSAFEGCYSMIKLCIFKIIILKCKLTSNQIRIHNDGSERGKAIRSLLMDVRCNETISMKD